MFKVKAYHFNPINVVCIVLLLTIVGLLVSGKPTSNTRYELDKDGIIREYEPPVLGPNDELRSYQLEVTLDGKGHELFILYDGDRVVGANTLDKHCNLTALIEMDND